ncbi:MAG: hypothetical protein CMIDDMOC_00108 [Sodalis sp. Fle]|nr:MAG: hypothetical protein CMIDDMOC_00108 [Sodalis sp. Fle]
MQYRCRSGHHARAFTIDSLIQASGLLFRPDDRYKEKTAYMASIIQYCQYIAGAVKRSSKSAAWHITIVANICAVIIPKNALPAFGALRDAHMCKYPRLSSSTRSTSRFPDTNFCSKSVNTSELYLRSAHPATSAAFPIWITGNQVFW